MPGHKDLFGFRSWYMDAFEPPPGARILDLGGYVGATAIHYAKKGHEVVTVEGAQEYIDQMRLNIAAAGDEVAQRITPVCCLFENFDGTGYNEMGFQACTCTEVLNLVQDPARVLQVAHRFLDDGGLLFVTVTLRRLRTSVRSYSTKELKDAVEQAGFDVKSCAEWDDGTHQPQIICRGHKV